MLHRFQLPLYPLIISIVSMFSLGLSTSKVLADSFGGFMLKDWISIPGETKAIYTKVIMEQATTHRVRLQHSPKFYEVELDNLARFSVEHHHDQLLQTPVAQSLATIAIINCDWENGIDPYAFALKHIGKEQLELLKGLYTDAIVRLENNCQPSNF